jgi:uncharacterized membrane protein
MKISKKLEIAGVAIVVILGAAILYSYIPQQTNIQTVEASIVYNYKDKNINQTLSNEEALTVYDIFNRKTLYAGNPSCGFTDNISIRFEDMIFCPAEDGCAIVMLQNKNKYFNITKNEQQEIKEIFFRHGGTLPIT